MVNGEVITTAGAGSRVVPSGVTSIDIEIWGGGASGTGGTIVEWGAAGGGAGGYSKRLNKAVTPGDTITFTIGSGGSQDLSPPGPSNAGGNTTCDSMTANGGGAGDDFTAGTGGTASGGDTNTTGGNAAGGGFSANGGKGCDAPNGGTGGATQTTQGNGNSGNTP